MQNQKTFQLSTLSAAVAATLISGYAEAQQPVLEEVVVTATRRAESVQDIPINIAAVSAEKIGKLGENIQVRRFARGTVVLDVIDRKAKQLVWTGQVSSAIQRKNPPSDRLAAVAEMLLEEIPPK